MQRGPANHRSDLIGAGETLSGDEPRLVGPPFSPDKPRCETPRRSLSERGVCASKYAVGLVAGAGETFLPLFALLIADFREQHLGNGEGVACG